MKLGSCIHLDKCSSKLSSILSLDLFFVVHCLFKFLFSFCVQVIFSIMAIRARAMKLGSCKHLDDCSSRPPSVLSLDLFMVH